MFFFVCVFQLASAPALQGAGHDVSDLKVTSFRNISVQFLGMKYFYAIHKQTPNRLDGCINDNGSWEFGQTDPQGK